MTTKLTTVYLVSNFNRERSEWFASRGEAFLAARGEFAAATGAPGTVERYDIPSGYQMTRHLAVRLLRGQAFASAITEIPVPPIGAVRHMARRLLAEREASDA